MTPLERLNWVSEVNRAKLPPAALKVAVVLAGMAFHNGECWPSHQTIADKAGLKRRAVINAVHYLTNAGFLKITKQAKGERHDKKTNLFKLCGVTAVTPREGERGVRPCTSGVSARAPKEGYIEEGKKSNKRKSAAKAFQEPTFAGGANPSSQELSNRTNQETTHSQSGKKEEASQLVEHYSKTVKTRSLDKSGSRKVFRKTAKGLLDKHSLSDLKAAADNYAEAEQGTEEKFRKGFQSFYGPKLELYRDYLPGEYEPALTPADEKELAIFEATLPDIERMEKEAQAIEKEKMQNVQRNR